jgi:hypothetical protein
MTSLFDPLLMQSDWVNMGPATRAPLVARSKTELWYLFINIGLPLIVIIGLLLIIRYRMKQKEKEKESDLS